MRPTDKASADSRSKQSFAIIKNTGNGKFVIGRFHTRARNGLFAGSETSMCTVAPSPTDTLCPIFSEGRGAAVHRLDTLDYAKLIVLLEN